MCSWLYLLTASVLLCGNVTNALPTNGSLSANVSHALPANGSLSAKVSHAVHSLKTTELCVQNPFFKVTKENFEESKALEWFAEWDAQVDRQSALYKKSASYYDYFIQTFVSPAEPVRCTIEACTELRCEDFVNAMQGDRDKARRVFFISICVKNIWTLAREMHDQANHMTGIIGLYAQEIAGIFIWQPNPKDEKKCHLLSGLVKTAITAVFLAVGAIPALGPELSESLSAATQAIIARYKLAGDVASNAIVYISGAEIDQGICKDFPHPGPHLWQQIAAKMTHYLGDSIVNLLGLLERDFNGLIMGNLTMNGASDVRFGKSTLAEKLLGGDYFILSPEILDMLQNPVYLTEGLRKLYIEKSIATCLRLGQCSIHCVSESIHHRGAEKEMASSRFSPRPGIWCQYQCWRDSASTKNIELFGLKALQGGTFAGVTLEDLGRHSYDHWEANRYHSPGAMDFSIEAFDNKTNDKGQIASSDLLPVCFSEMAPHDFHHDENSDKVLSCFCGNSLGNETAVFFQAIHIQEWDGFKHKGLGNACDTSYRKDRTWPLATFMGYCRIAQAGLAIDGGQKFIDGGPQLDPDPRCDNFTEEVRTLINVEKMGRLAASHYMCEKSALGRDIRAYPGQQDSPARVWHDGYDFDQACRALPKTQ